MGGIIPYITGTNTDLNSLETSNDLGLQQDKNWVKKPKGVYIREVTLFCTLMPTRLLKEPCYSGQSNIWAYWKPFRKIHNTQRAKLLVQRTVWDRGIMSAIKRKFWIMCTSTPCIWHKGKISFFHICQLHDIGRG